MDFKERFKGRTTTVSKEGIAHTLNAPSSSVQKSQYKDPANSSSKSFAPNASNDIQDSRISRTRLSQEKPAENRPIMPPHPETHYYSKTPIHQHQPMNDSPNYPRYMPSNSAPNSANKNPYMVNNPFPQIDSLDNHFNNTHNNNNMRGYNYQNGPEQGRAPQEVSHFNPNSFYNQHSQYKNAPGMTPKKDGSENQPVYKAASTSQLVKKNFDNLSLQNKQKRGEEPVRGFDFQYRPPHSSNNRLEGLNNYNNNNNYEQHNYGMPPPMFGYNGPRDIHSNPASYQNYPPNTYGQFPQNMTYQFERGPEQNSVPNRLYNNNNNGVGMIRSLSNTGQNYKPLAMKDVKDGKKAPIKLGGLGPNTNTDEWFKQKEKKDKMSEFSQNVKMFNQQRISNTETNFKTRRDNQKDKSRREIALEFAKNIPKPRVRSHQPEDYYPGQEGYENELDLDNMNPNDLDEFEQRHRLYKAQLGKMNLY